MCRDKNVMNAKNVYGFKSVHQVKRESRFLLEQRLQTFLQKF